jgi:membrane-associated phospholipid phosphatase
MSRGVGELAFVAQLPEVIVVFAALLTQLGDVWFVFGLLGLLYWFGTSLPGPLSFDRTRAAFAVALGLGAHAVVTTLKEWLAYPRPPGADVAVGRDLMPALVEPLYVAAATATGFGLPSGHATAAAIIYGGLALLVGTRRAYGSAAALVVVIALSRIVLQVHYLVDVVFGVTVGAAYLAVVYRLCGRGSNPGRALMLAVVAALFGPILGGYNFDTMAVLGGTLGARIAWGSLGDAVIHEEMTRTGGAIAVVVGVVFGGLFGIIYTAHAAPHVAFLGMGIALAGVIAAPLVGEAVARRV